MLEFSSISVSSYDAASLADHLTARSAEGWEVVAIVPAGTNVTAYLSRAADSGATAHDTDDGADAADDDIAFSFGGSAEPAAVSTPEAAAAGAALGESAVASEPSGWASAPESSSTSSPTDPVPPFGTSDSGSSAASTPDTGTTDSGSSATDAVTEPAQQAAVSTEAAAPAGWYADPAGRFELRYWDGGQWTEHVSRAGQQYTDPPVA